MTPLLTINLLRVLFVTFCAVIGANISSALIGNLWPGLVLGLVLGLVVVLIDRLLKGVSMRWSVRLIVYAVFGYLGMMLAMRSSRDEFSLIIPYVRFARETTQHEPLVVDTNVIIDGRISDLCATGFLSRSLIVPRFVLDELQLLADSREPAKRERGRRGLEILNQLQGSRKVELTVHDSTSEDVELGADARLVRVAKVLKARLLTNDHALTQVARLQRVAVLNLSDLTRALRPTVVAGDEIDLHLVKEGRESHQAVGYLPDGTMIVVNHARAHVGKTRTVVVASALQTAAGRLIFAELKNGAAQTSVSREPI